MFITNYFRHDCDATLAAQISNWTNASLFLTGRQTSFHDLAINLNLETKNVLNISI